MDASATLDRTAGTAKRADVMGCAALYAFAGHHGLGEADNESPGGRTTPQAPVALPQPMTTEVQHEPRLP